MPTTTTPTNEQLTQGFWAWSKWDENTAGPRTLVGTIELDGDHDDDDDVTLVVLDAPDGAHLWSDHRPPSRYVIRRTSPHLRPAWTEEAATIADRADRHVAEMVEQLEAATAAARIANAAYEQAWQRDAADELADAAR